MTAQWWDWREMVLALQYFVGWGRMFKMPAVKLRAKMRRII